jgi:hypothetical protein
MRALVSRWTNSTIRAQASSCSSLYSPVQPGVMRLGDHQPGAADGAAAQVHQVPVLGHAIDRRVLAHGRDHYAVGQLQAA